MDVANATMTHSVARRNKRLGTRLDPFESHPKISFTLTTSEFGCPAGRGRNVPRGSALQPWIMLQK